MSIFEFYFKLFSLIFAHEMARIRLFFGVKKKIKKFFFVKIFIFVARIRSKIKKNSPAEKKTNSRHQQRIRAKCRHFGLFRDSENERNGDIWREMARNGDISLFFPLKGHHCMLFCMLININ